MPNGLPIDVRTGAYVTPEALQSLAWEQSVTCTAPHPRRGLLLAASGGALLWWDPAMGGELRELARLESPPVQLSCAVEQAFVLCADGRVEGVSLGSVRSERELLLPPSARERERAYAGWLAATPDGERLAVGAAYRDDHTGARRSSWLARARSGTPLALVAEESPRQRLDPSLPPLWLPEGRLAIVDGTSLNLYAPPSWAPAGGVTLEARATAAALVGEWLVVGDIRARLHRLRLVA